MPAAQSAAGTRARLTNDAADGRHDEREGHCAEEGEDEGEFHGSR